MFNVFLLGLTNFDLLGDFGRIEWLGSFKLVLFYNIIFASAAIGCLVTKFTATVRKEIYARLRSSLLGIFKRDPIRGATMASTLSSKDD